MRFKWLTNLFWTFIHLFSCAQCLLAAQGQVPSLNHWLSELLWMLTWSSLPSCGKCLLLRLQPGPQGSNCFSTLLNWKEHIIWLFSPPCQASPLWLSPSPLPRGSDSYDSAYRGGTSNLVISTRLPQHTVINWAWLLYTLPKRHFPLLLKVNT